MFLISVQSIGIKKEKKENNKNVLNDSNLFNLARKREKCRNTPFFGGNGGFAAVSS